MDTLQTDVLEHVMTYCDQRDKLACSTVSKSLHHAAMNPRVWTAVKLCSVTRDAQRFLKECIQCTSVTLLLEDDQLFHQFAASVYPDTISRVAVTIQGGLERPVCSLFFYHIFKAFPGLRDLEVTVRGLVDPLQLNVPGKTLDSFVFRDAGNPDQWVHLNFDGPLLAKHVDIRANSTNIGVVSPDTVVDALFICASGIIAGATAFPEVIKQLTIDIDGHYVMDMPIQVDHLHLVLGGAPEHALVVPLPVVKQWKIKSLSIRLIEDAMENIHVDPIMFFRETTALEFYNYFYGPQRCVDLHLAEDVAFAVLPV